MRDEIGQFFTDLKDRIAATDEEEKKLNQEEVRERKYIENLSGENTRKQRKQVLKTLVREINLAEEIEENLAAAEKDEIQIENIVIDSNEPIGEEIKKQIDSSESEIENLVDTFLDEVQTLNNSAENLYSILTGSGDSELVAELESNLERLEDINSRTEELESGREQIEVGRRKVLAGGAALATGMNLQSLVDSAEAVEQESSGKTVEVLEIEEIALKIHAEIIRTSPNSGYALMEVENYSQTERNIEVEIDIAQWAASGATNIMEGDTNNFRTKFGLNSKSMSACGLTLYEPSDNLQPGPGAVKFLIKSDKWEKDLEIMIPESVAEDHEVTNSRNIPGLDIEYSSTPIESRGANEEHYRVDISAKNKTGNNLEASVSLNYPIGWYKTGVTGDFDQGASGLVVGDLRDLSLGDEFDMAAKLVKNSHEASSIGLITVTYFPKNHPEKAEYFLLPVDLD